MKRAKHTVVLLLCLSSTFLGAAPTISNSAAQQVLKSAAREHPLLVALAGQWSGRLEYADYGDNSRVTLPTALEARLAADGQSVELKFTYQEPSGKKVGGTSVLSFDANASKYRWGSQDYTAAAVKDAATGKGEKWLLSGEVTENGQKVAARITIALTGDTLTILKETRTPLEFRNQYTLQRAK